MLGLLSTLIASCDDTRPLELLTARLEAHVTGADLGDSNATAEVRERERAACV